MLTNISLATLSAGIFFGLCAGHHWDIGMAVCAGLAVVAFARAAWAEYRRADLAAENAELWDTCMPTVPLRPRVASVPRMRSSVDWGEAGRDSIRQIPLPVLSEFTSSTTINDGPSKGAA